MLDLVEKLEDLLANAIVSGKIELGAEQNPIRGADERFFWLRLREICISTLFI